MATLFGKKHKSRKRVRQEDALASANEDKAPGREQAQHEEQSLAQAHKKPAAIVDEDVDAQPAARSFQELGLCSWICDSCTAMGFKRPTPVQSTCIPAIIAGKDVLACAETGSGKTAAFALPILHKLSQDPYGVFAVVLTPTRELALQIAEQFEALGTPMGLRYELVIGGVNMMRQSLALKERPHVIIATPGRLRHHLEGPDPPDLSKVKFLVLDEADRLLTIGFQR
jgi:ATP-dependent RNA helicase DDX49/DBP8